LLDTGALKVRTMTLPDIYQDQASPAEMYIEAGLTADTIAKETLKTFAAGTSASSASHVAE
ncbi:MAG: hypothetical protein AAF608_14475, partial [Pseudomonadota bacterium]